MIDTIDQFFEDTWVMMSDDEIFVFVVASIISFFGLMQLLFCSKHRLYRRRAEAEGFVRVAFVLALAWIIHVLYHYADPSVVGIYRLFYVNLGFAVILLFGSLGSRFTGMRRRVDVLERNNLAAGLLVAAFVLGTGMIYGGSLWGEADPDGEGEGGWWIPMGFFLAGWFSLALATRLYRGRETDGNIRIMRQMRNPREALGFALYILSSAWILTESVSGDFYGWRSGLIAVGSIGGMLITHELVGMTFRSDQQTKPKAMTGIEVVMYIGWSVIFTWLNRYLLPRWGIDL